MEWNDRFLALFDNCATLYREGNKDYVHYYSERDLQFLHSIGYKPREMFDFIEDYVDEGVPSPSTALLVASVRRDYLLSVQKGIWEDATVIGARDLPTFGDALDGLTYLPRIILKARGKLRGVLDPDIMFCCGGDRKFLREHGNIHPADFLRRVWAAGSNDDAIAQYVRRRMAE